MPLTHAQHPTSQRLLGHLHGLFGRHLHRLHAADPEPIPAGSGTAPGPTPGSGLSPSPDGPVGHLVDMESVDWKHQRAVRLITLDGTTLSYTDLQFVPPPAVGSRAAPGTAPAAAASHYFQHSGQQHQQGHAQLGSGSGAGRNASEVTVEDKGFFYSHDSARVIGQYVVLITCPPDARHSPQLRPGYGSASGLGSEAVPVWGCGPNTGSGGSSGSTTGNGPQDSATVRVLVLPAAAAVPAVAPKVVLEWECVGTAEGGQPGGVGASATGGGAAGRGVRQLSGRVQVSPLRRRKLPCSYRCLA